MEERVKELDERMARIEDKLDSLLTLKNKGAGAFWLASILFGTGVVGIAVKLFHLFGVR